MKNNNRTYGVEIECHSRISHTALQEKIQNAFLINNSQHQVQVPGRYYHNTDATNFFTWEIKPDGSLTGSPFEDFNIGTEIVSPVLSGDDGLAALKIVCEAIKNDVRISVKCGLHVHHGISISEFNKNLVNSWLNCQDHFYAALPSSRQNNVYCKKYNAQKAEEGTPIELWRQQNNVCSRYYGLNLESFWLRGTVEFRCHSGSIEFDKINNWVKVTQRWLEKAVKEEIAPDSFKDMVSKLRDGGVVASKNGTQADKINKLLATPRTATEIAALVNCTPARVSSHIRYLRNNGIVVSAIKEQGKTKYARQDNGDDSDLDWLTERRNYFTR